MKKILLAQNLGHRDAGSSAASRPQGDAGTKPAPTPPRLTLDSSPALTKAAEGSNDYKEVLRQHYFKFLTLAAKAAVSVPEDVHRGGTLTVGFIQNLLSRELLAKYHGKNDVTWKTPKGALLDIGDGAKETDWPWMGPAAAHMQATFDYEAGNTAELSYQDAPGAHYWNFYADQYDASKDPQGNELSSIVEKMEVALWLAARMENDDAQDWKSYSVLWSCRLRYTATLTITKTLSQLRAEAKKHGMETYRTLGSPEFEFDNNLKPSESTANLVPILKGPSANEICRRLIPKAVYAGQ